MIPMHHAIPLQPAPPTTTCSADTHLSVEAAARPAAPAPPISTLPHPNPHHHLECEGYGDAGCPRPHHQHTTRRPAGDPVFVLLLLLLLLALIPEWLEALMVRHVLNHVLYLNWINA